MEFNSKMLPRPTAETVEFWEACKKHRLLIQKCYNCGLYQFFPRIMCKECWSSKIEWIESSGVGVIKTFSIMRYPLTSAYAEETPYIIGLIELLEGPVMMSNIVYSDLSIIEIGQQVEVLFEKWTDAITVPKFKVINNA